MKAVRILIRDPELVALLDRGARIRGLTITAYIIRILRQNMGIDR